ncbi:hypothetical protein ADL26_04380, partial [Thermoactinomyces vulgaris]
GAAQVGAGAFVDGEGEGGEDGPLPAAVNRRRPTVDGDLERPEQSDSDHVCHGAASRSDGCIRRAAGPGDRGELGAGCAPGGGAAERHINRAALA